MVRIGVLLTSALAALAALLPPSAQATFPGRNGAIIAATHSAGAHAVIWAIGPTGGAAHVVFRCSTQSCPLEVSGVRVSSSGRLAVFNADTFVDPYVLRKRIWILQLQSRRAHQLPLLPGPDNEYPATTLPSWMPGAPELMFSISMVDGETRNLGLFTADSTGGHLRQLTACDCTEPQASPNGKLILFERGREVWIANSDGSNPRRFSQDAEQASWAPGGDRVAFVSLAHGWDLTIARADGSHRRKIASNASTPVWSPNGRLGGDRLAFVSFARGGSDLVVLRPDGSHRQTIAGNAGSPAWSPDGKLIAFDRGSSIYTIRADGTRMRKVFTNHSNPEMGFGGFDWQPLPAG